MNCVQAGVANGCDKSVGNLLYTVSVFAHNVEFSNVSSYGHKFTVDFFKRTVTEKEFNRQSSAGGDQISGQRTAASSGLV